MTDTTFYPWGHRRRYNDFPTFFRNKFSGRVQKVSIDAGFTCPNRDGTKGFGGCTYCNNQTFQPDYCRIFESVTEQVQKGVGFFSKKYETMRFLAYFQSYSNTYAPIDTLRKLYDDALQHPKIIGLVVATRPDCIDDDLPRYLKQLSQQHYVMIELGVESHKDSTLRLLNRGHTISETVDAIERISAWGIHNCAHTILGLPGESRSDFVEQARFISSLPFENLKLHQLQIHHNTLMADQFQQNPEWFDLFRSVDEYIETVVEYIEYLRPTIIIERFVSTSPLNMLVAPKWGIKNFEFTAKLEKRLEGLNTFQGRKWQKNNI
jgi:radical SAM protein (TIGR01212 family)